MNTPQDFFAVFEESGTNKLVIFGTCNIDAPEGEHGDFAVPEPVPASSGSLAPAPTIPADIILARVHGIDEYVHECVRDVQVGDETVVVNPILNAEYVNNEERGHLDGVVDIGTVEDGLEAAEANADGQGVQVGLQELTPDLVIPTPLVSTMLDGQLETDPSEEMIRILDNISRTVGTLSKFTATTAPFGTSSPQPAIFTFVSATTPMVVSTHERIVKPALEAVNLPHTAARVLDKADGESAEEPALKRQAVKKDPEATSNQPGPSEAQT